MSEATETFARRVAGCSEELGKLLEQDIAFYGELLPHLYFGEVSAWAIDIAKGGGSSAHLRFLVEVLEEGCAAGGPDVEELIVVSFVENTYDPDVVRMYGPRLCEAASKI